ncbi:MAG TPA: F0F1 ATP synthase subunit B [Gemmatimonadales bacterium]|jgi:F-type H+-transporting ATPase subunit b
MRKSLGLALLLVTATGGPVFGQESGGGGGGPLTVDGGLVIWTLVVFGLLLYVLRRSAWPVLLAAVREREQKLERQLAEAEKNRAEAAALLEEHKRLVAAARGEAQEILNKAKTVAEKERATLLAKAREEYEQLLARARKEIGEEKEKALLALRREAVDLSIAAAVRLLDASLDTEANRRLVTEYLAGLELGR